MPLRSTSMNSTLALADYLPATEYLAIRTLRVGIGTILNGRDWVKRLCVLSVAASSAEREPHPRPAAAFDQ